MQKTTIKETGKRTVKNWKQLQPGDDMYHYYRGKIFKHTIAKVEDFEQEIYGRTYYYHLFTTIKGKQIKISKEDWWGTDDTYRGYYGVVWFANKLAAIWYVDNQKAILQKRIYNLEQKLERYNKRLNSYDISACK